MALRVAGMVISEARIELDRVCSIAATISRNGIAIDPGGVRQRGPGGRVGRPWWDHL
jgi:hypothetical protein